VSARPAEQSMAVKHRRCCRTTSQGPERLPRLKWGFSRLSAHRVDEPLAYPWLDAPDVKVRETGRVAEGAIVVDGARRANGTGKLKVGFAD
jgi:hypothetical protein